jgi:hypothetical protein
MDNVLVRPDDTPLKTALVNEGINNTMDLQTIKDKMIDDLEYEDPKKKGTYHSVNKGDKNLVRCFLDYIRYRHHTGNPINNNWTSITTEMFDTFRADPTYMGPISNSPSPPGQPKVLSSATSSSGNSYSPADLFRRGIKRDPSVYPVLKDERYNDQWHRSFINQARAQDVSDVLDSTYVPSSPTDIDLFI